MEASIYMEFHYGIGPEAIVKELALVSDGVVQTFLFKPHTLCTHTVQKKTV